MSTLIVPEHMGGLHAYEQALVLLLAFGPLLVLGIVIRFVRRRDLAEEQELAPGSRDVTAPR